MKHVAAYLLASLSGNAPTVDSVKAILSSVGVEADDEALNTVFAQLEGKDLAELLAAGNKKLASVPSGGGGGAAPAAAAGGAAPAAAVEEEEEEEEEEEMGDGGGLFDDDDDW